MPQDEGLARLRQEPAGGTGCDGRESVALVEESARDVTPPVAAATGGNFFLQEPIIDTLSINVL